MQLYSPFVAINKTGFPLNIKCRNGKPVAGQVENRKECLLYSRGSQLTRCSANLAETTPFSEFGDADLWNSIC